MELGLAAPHADRPFAIEPTPVLAVMLFGALTEAGISLSHAATPSREDLLHAMRALTDALTT
jgi:hypothetical protein